MRYNRQRFQASQKGKKLGRGDPKTHSLGKKDPGMVEPNQFRTI